MGLSDELNLTDREYQILQSEMESHKRSVGIAYVLLFFTGGFGGHKLYIGKWGWAIIYSILTVLAPFSSLTSLLVLGIFIIYDLVTLPKQIEKKRGEKKTEIVNKIRSESQEAVFNS